MSKSPKNLEPPTHIQKRQTTQPCELEDFEMINESQDLPAVGDKTSINSPASQKPPASSINAAPDSKGANWRTHGGRG